MSRRDLGSMTYSLKNTASKAKADSADTSKPDMRPSLLPSLENSALTARQVDKLFQTFRYLNGFIAFHRSGEVCGTRGVCGISHRNRLKINQQTWLTNSNVRVLRGLYSEINEYWICMLLYYSDLQINYRVKVYLERYRFLCRWYRCVSYVWFWQSGHLMPLLWSQ